MLQGLAAREHYGGAVVRRDEEGRESRGKSVLRAQRRVRHEGGRRPAGAGEVLRGGHDTRRDPERRAGGVLVRRPARARSRATRPMGSSRKPPRTRVGPSMNPAGSRRGWASTDPCSRRIPRRRAASCRRGAGLPGPEPGPSGSAARPRERGARPVPGEGAAAGRRPRTRTVDFLVADGGRRGAGRSACGGPARVPRRSARRPRVFRR